MKFLNGWLMINTGGGDPTPDKLTVSVEAPRVPNSCRRRSTCQARSGATCAIPMVT